MFDWLFCKSCYVNGKILFLFDTCECPANLHTPRLFLGDNRLPLLTFGCQENLSDIKSLVRGHHDLNLFPFKSFIIYKTLIDH